jgi:threonine aldolase
LLAAAGLYAVQHQIDRLAEDHRRAAELAKALSDHPAVEEVAPVETNILIFRLKSGKPEADFMESASRKERQFIDMGSGLKRLVTHMDYTEAMHQYVMEFLGSDQSSG